MTSAIYNFLLLLLWGNIDRRNGCWVWTGPTRTRYPLARAVYEITTGPIPHGFTITTTCQTKNCIRPLHVILGRRFAIKDEFTKLPICRERKRQLRKLQAGLCKDAGCTRSKVTSCHCKAHAIEDRERKRARAGSVRRNNSMTYKL